MDHDDTRVELARLPVAKMQDVLLARFVGRDEATKLGFSPTSLTRVATMVSEITRNVIQHAGCAGEIRIGRTGTGERTGLWIEVSDTGRGIPDADRLLRDERLAACGSGLHGARRLADEFHLRSGAGAGTTVKMVVWKGESEQ